MSSIYRNLPVEALIGFEAAARLESVSLAAAELNMTQSAVSSQPSAIRSRRWKHSWVSRCFAASIAGWN